MFKEGYKNDVAISHRHCRALLVSKTDYIIETMAALSSGAGLCLPKKNIQYQMGTDAITGVIYYIHHEQCMKYAM